MKFNLAFRLALGVIIVILFFVLVSLVFGVHNRKDNIFFVYRFREMREPVEFTVVPKNNFLNILIVPLKNPGLQDSGNFIFSLIKNGQMIRKINFSGKNIGDPSDVHFQFEPVENSSGSNIKVQIIPEGKHEHFVSLGYTQDNNVAYQSYYKANNKVDIISQILRDFLKKFLTDPVFLFMWFLVLGILAWQSKEKK